MVKKVCTILACLILGGCASYWDGVSRAYTRHVTGQQFNCASHLVLCIYDDQGQVIDVMPVNGAREVYKVYDENGNYKGKIVK